jgi:hypothetical protein
MAAHPQCAHCGLAEGAVDPRTGKKMHTLPIAQAIPRRGVLLWCSMACRAAWHAAHSVAG